MVRASLVVHRQDASSTLLSDCHEASLAGLASVRPVSKALRHTLSSPAKGLEHLYILPVFAPLGIA